MLGTFFASPSRLTHTDTTLAFTTFAAICASYRTVVFSEGGVTVTHSFDTHAIAAATIRAALFGAISSIPIVFTEAVSTVLACTMFGACAISRTILLSITVRTCKTRIATTDASGAITDTFVITALRTSNLRTINASRTFVTLTDTLNW